MSVKFVTEYKVVLLIEKLNRRNLRNLCGLIYSVHNIKSSQVKSCQPVLSVLFLYQMLLVYMLSSPGALYVILLILVIALML